MHRQPCTHGPRPGLAAALRPLVIDVGIPLGTYYLLRDVRREPVASWR